MKNPQKICCNVASCTHNNVEHCACMLDKIEVCKCNLDLNDKTSDTETSCKNFKYVGDENIYGSSTY